MRKLALLYARQFNLVPSSKENPAGKEEVKWESSRKKTAGVWYSSYLFAPVDSELMVEATN